MTKHERATRRALVVLSLLCAVVAPAPGGGQTSPGSELRVWLVTMGPGDLVWERYGHNAIRVLDTRTGRDVSYNWGTFDFDQVDFETRFLRGRMLYRLSVWPTQPMIDAYAALDREVVLQELHLTPAQKLELYSLAETNALPANAEYIYQYYLDNCSTRVRDLLDRVLGGALRDAFDDVPTGLSYRDHTQRLASVDPLIFTGLDALLGAPTDHELTVWEEMFIPMTVRDAIRDLAVPGADGETRPLVISEVVAVPSTRPAEPDAPPRWTPVYLALGALLGSLFASLGSARVRDASWARRSIVVLGVVWSLLGAVLGTILLALLFTDHTFAYRNENLFLFTPLLFGTAALLPLSGATARWRRRARVLAGAVAALALLGLLWQLAPWSHHRNTIFFALALPPHLGMAWGLGVRVPGPGRPRDLAPES